MQQIATNDQLQALLFQAARDGDRQKIAPLIAAGAQVNSADKDGITALIMAATNGHLKCVCLFIAYEARVNLADNRGLTALMYAATFGHIDCVQELMGAEVQENSADLVEKLLYVPNDDQIMSIITTLGCLSLRHRRRRDDVTSISRAFKGEIYLYNKRNIPQSVAGQALATLPEGKIKKKLREIYKTHDKKRIKM